MNVSKSVQIGTLIGGALGGVAGYMVRDSEDEAVSCAILGVGAGQLGGALIGGTFDLARKLNPVALGALLGGGAASLGGSFLCTLLAAPTLLWGGNSTELICFWGGCTGVAAAAGAATGAGIAKITMISQRALEQKEPPHEE